MNRLMQAAILIASLLLGGGQSDAARAHRAKHFAPKEYGYIYYVTIRQTSAIDGESKAALVNQSRFTIASSSSQQIIERCTPRRVAPGLYYIDLRDLRWNYKDFHQVLAKYPYSTARLPLIIRSDWLVVQLGDESNSNARPLLLYGDDKFTRDQFLKFWKVANNKEDHFGYNEGDSGVGVAKKRFIENRPTAKRSWAWGTRDSAIIDRDSDPLEHPDNNFDHDAEEWLVGMPKVSIETHARGVLMDCLLCDDKGVRQTIAPANIVNGGTNFRGVTQIQNFGACIVCHNGGLKKPTVNERRESLAAGYRLYAQDKRKAEQAELFHLGDVVAAMESDTNLFAAGVQLCNGLEIAENAKQFRQVFALYDADVTLGQAAHELGYSEADLKLAIGHATNIYDDLGARVATLAQGRAMRRTSFESEYRNILKALRYAKADGVIQ